MFYFIEFKNGHNESGKREQELVRIKYYEALLKPCPFCGENASINKGGGEYFVMCEGCRVMTMGLAEMDQVVEPWNERI